MSVTISFGLCFSISFSTCLMYCNSSILSLWISGVSQILIIYRHLYPPLYIIIYLYMYNLSNILPRSTTACLYLTRFHIHDVSMYGFFTHSLWYARINTPTPKRPPFLSTIDILVCMYWSISFMNQWDTRTVICCKETWMRRALQGLFSHTVFGNIACETRPDFRVGTSSAYFYVPCDGYMPTRSHILQRAP